MFYLYGLNAELLSIFTWARVLIQLFITQAEGQAISPHVVRKALENTAAPISNKAEEALTTGRGLLQVDR